MKNIFKIFLLSAISFSCNCIAQTNAPYDFEKPFAKIVGDSFEIQIDTTAFKKYVKDNLLSDTNKPITLQKIEVRKQMTIGERKEICYYILITDFANHVRITKSLYKKDKALFSINKSNGNDNFERMYLICGGVENCAPNICIIDGKRVWICGENPSCLKPGLTLPFKMYRSILE